MGYLSLKAQDAQVPRAIHSNGLNRTVPGPSLIAFGLDLVDIFAGGAATYVYWHTAGLSVDYLEAAYQNAVRAHRAYVYIRNASNEVFAIQLFGIIAGGTDMTAWYIRHEPH